MSCLPFVEAGSLRARPWQSWFLLCPVMENLLGHCLASGVCWNLSVPYLWKPHSHLCLHPHLPVCASMSNVPFSDRHKSCWIRVYAKDLILT